VIDAEGRRVVAGFNDAHVHFATGSAQLARVDLRDADSPAEFARQPVDQLLTRWMAADHAGLQLCVNPGDAGVAKTLDLLADVVRANGERDRRFRVERAEQSTASDVDRFAALNAVASIQPASREAAAGAIARLRDRRVRLAFGSDWPALPLNPMPGLAAAGRHMPIAEALGAYTRGSAAAEFQDGDKGTLERGKLADIVILSDDLLAVRSDRVRSVTVLTTIVGGKVVHQRRP
jgi:predicted amidohydrolase YtcJ